MNGFRFFPGGKGFAGAATFAAAAAAAAASAAAFASVSAFFAALIFFCSFLVGATAAAGAGMDWAGVGARAAACSIARMLGFCSPATVAAMSLALRFAPATHETGGT